MLEKHHIVFRSQGGLDFELNYKYLTSEEHRGDKGPHKCRETDLKYKKELQDTLFEILEDDFYTIYDVVDLLGLDKKQAEKAFRKLPYSQKGIKKEDIIRRLMGGKLYF